MSNKQYQFHVILLNVIKQEQHVRINIFKAQLIVLALPKAPLNLYCFWFSKLKSLGDIFWYLFNFFKSFRLEMDSKGGF